MPYLSIKEYAIKHKISIFNVMKMIKSKQLDTITKLVDKKEIIYIIDNDTPNKHQKTLSEAPSIQNDIQTEVEQLKQEIAKLRSELNTLKVTVFKMAKKDAKILKI